MLLRGILFILVFNLGLASFVQAQTTDLSEQELALEEKAYKLFNDNNFIEALPLFSQLLSLYPKEVEYNYGYAVCLIETNQQIEKSIKYLQFADSQSDNPLVKLYLGRAYHLMYKFDEAIGYYTVFKEKGTASEKSRHPVDNYITMCKNGKELVRYISDLIVVDNKKIKSDNYHYSYELTDFGGKLILKPAEFKSKVDKKIEPQNTVIFLPKNTDSVYYASWGDKKISRDIYLRTKKADGTWNLPVKLPPVINTSYDEDYPFMHPDGKTLYFCSRGHNSMGGYDIFRTVWDTTKKTWSKPVNLDFPINSPYDDYLFVPDQNEIYAYFASNRETNEDKISVYKILIDKEPVERQYNNLEEIINKQKLEVSSLADIKKAEDTRFAELNKNQNNTNLTAENNTVLSGNDFAFKPIKYTEDLTAADLSKEAANDAGILNDQADELQKQADIALLTADSKNKQANDRRKEAGDRTAKLNNITDPSLRESEEETIVELITEAENLEQEAVVAYNVSQNLENNAGEIRKDAQKSKDISEAMLNPNAANSASTESLVEAINKNREKLNNSQDKYSNLDKEIEERKTLADQKNAELTNVEAEYNAMQNDIASLEDEVSILQKQIDEEQDLNRKNDLLSKLNDKTEQLDRFNNQEQILAEKYEKTKIASEALNAETDFLNALDKDIGNNNRTTTEVADLRKDINKDVLKKDIFEKELTADMRNANLIAENANKNENANKPKNNENNQTNNNLTAENTNQGNQNANSNQNLTTDQNAAGNQENNNTNNQNLTTDQNNSNTNQNNNEIENIKASNEVKSLYIQSKRNDQIADSLTFLADQKEQALGFITDPGQKTIVENEIAELRELSRIKKNQSQNQLKSAREKEEKLVASTNTENQFSNNKSYPFNNSEENPSDLTRYQQELLNAQYYQGLADETEKQVEVIKSGLDKIEDPGTKEAVEKQISDMENIIRDSKVIAEKSSREAEKLRESAVNEMGNNELTSDQMLLSATQYNPKNEIRFTKEQEDILSLVKDDRKYTSNVYNEYTQTTTQISDLEKQLASTNNAKEKKSIEKDITNLKLKQTELIGKYKTASSESNQDEAFIYKDLLDKTRIVDDGNEDLKLANNLEKEADLYFEKANNMRKDAELRTSPEEMALEYKKSDNLEQIGIQKQKYALDLYLSSTTIAANNPDTNSVINITPVNNFNTQPTDTSDNSGKQPVSLTLSPDEENQINLYQQNKHTADVMISEAEKNLADVEQKKSKAASVYSTKEKQEILKGVDKQEAKSLQMMTDAYNLQEKADSLKYHLYANQLNQLTSSAPDIGNNKAIARQYQMEADFYYSEAGKVRISAEKINDPYIKIEELKRATELEKKALTSQEYAVDVLTDSEPVFFISDNQLVRVDPMDALNQKVNVDEVIKVRTERIVEKLNITEEEKQRLDAMNKVKGTADGLLADAANYQANIDSLRLVVQNGSARDKKKAEKQIPKLEKQVLASQFTSAELFENINDSRFYVYKDNIAKVRMNDNSTEARQGKQLEKDANEKYRKAKNLRDRSFVSENPAKAYEMILQAQKLEAEAIEDQERALGIYLELRPLDEEIREYAEANKAKNTQEENILLIKSTADITPIETPVDTSSNLADNNPNLRNTETNNTEEPVDTNNTGNLVVVNNVSNNQETPVDTNLVANNATDLNNQNPDNNSGNRNTPADTSNASNNADLNNLAHNLTNDNNNQGENQITNSGNQTSDNNQGGNRTTDAGNQTGDNNQSGNQTTNTGNRTGTDNSNYRPPVDMNGFGFSILPMNAYSAANPIPMNPTLPSGIVFKVQIGAFKVPIKPEIFKGINPLCGEQLPNSALVRYLVGLFYTEEAASLVREQVRILGYKDAFIVAYKDGKRIPLFEARRLLREGFNPDYANLVKTEVENIQNRTANTQMANLNNNAGNNNAGNNNAGIQEAVVATSLGNTSGLLYTVQIGVYKAPVSAATLKNLSPVYEEKVYDFIRYTTGKFDNVNKAIAEKDRIVQLGITDAFVTAYHNGKRISLVEAKKLESGGNVTKTSDENVRFPEQEATNNNATTENTNLTEVNKENVVFKVQIGAYNEQVPVDVVSQFLTLASAHGLDQIKDASGSTLYCVGKFNTYQDATMMKDILINQGVKDAFVVAFNGTTKISVNEARKILGQ